jgi:hypothetical protein
VRIKNSIDLAKAADRDLKGPSVCDLDDEAIANHWLLCRDLSLNNVHTGLSKGS